MFDNEGKTFFGFRQALLWFFIGIGALSWVYAEGASFLNLIGYSSARWYWGMILFSGLSWAAVTQRRRLVNLPRKAADIIRDRRLSGFSMTLIIGGGVFILLTLFALAIFTPPNNYDSNNYHLHRVLAWIHYGNLGHFPTPYLQQLYLNVFAEYAVLNLYLVTGSDHLVNLVQFAAGLGCLAGISLLAKLLGLSRSGQIMAAFSLLTLPVFIFEMTTTQVELVASCYFVAFLCFGYQLKCKFEWGSLIGMGLSLAFSVFAKYPAALYAIPFCAYFGVCYLRNHGLLRSGAILLVMVTSIGLIFAPFWGRNYALFGNILNPVDGSAFLGEKLTTDGYKLKYTISNVLKNSSLHLGLPHRGFNQAIENRILKVHELMGVDVSEPATSRDSFEVKYAVHEDTVPNTVHFLLLILFTGGLLFLFRENSRVLSFWLLAVAGFLLFCSALKFQLWSTRTHLPFFIMGAVLTGFVLSNVRVVVRNTILILLFVPALFFVVGNPSKPVIPLAYMAKKIMAHIPVNLCVDSLTKAEYADLLHDAYDFEEVGTGCFPLRSRFDFHTRKQIFQKLDELGYYKPLSETVFNTSRADLYFLNDRQKHRNFRELIPEIKGANPGIGVMWHLPDGFYFYQASLKAATGVKADFDYIYSPRSFSFLENARRPHCYEYVLTDDVGLVSRYFSPESIEKVVPGRGKLSLVCLKETHCGRFEF